MLARQIRQQRVFNGVKFAALFVCMILVGWAGLDLLNDKPEEQRLRDELHKKIGQQGALSPEEQARLDALEKQRQSAPAGREIKKP